MDILSVVTRVPILVFGIERHDDDFADRINYKYTVAVLVIFAIIVTNRQFGTKQIHCWIPAYFTRNYEEYINDICWVSNTYYISLDQKLPEADQIRKSFELKYYQWVPFILLSQAFFFYIPHIAWRALSRRSGIDVRDIVEAAGNYKSVDKYEIRKKYMSYMLTAVDQYCDDPRRRKESRGGIIVRRILSAICCISGKFLGNYLMVLYLFIKLTFIANCLSQMFLLNLLLGHEFHKFGFELIDKILNGKGWDTGSRIFPKISMCDFRIREVGNPKVSHRYTVQCVLPINLFNQQIFTFIWFWYAIVLIINIYSLIVWTYRFLPSKRLRYIKRRIDIMRQALFWRNKNPLNFEQMPESLQMHEFEVEIIQHFVHEYLESDGLFILRVLSSNTSDFVCTELIQELWKYYRKQRKFNRSSEDDEDLYDDESLENSNSDQESTSKIPLRSNSKSQESRKIKMIENTKPQPDSCRDDDVDDDDDSDDDDDCEENNEDEDFEDLGEQKKFTHRNITTKSRKLSKSSLSNQRLSKIKQIDIKQNNDGQRNAKDISTTKIANKDDDDTPLYDLPLKKSSINKRASVPNKKVALKSKSLTKPFVAFSGQIANIYKSKKASIEVINSNESIEENPTQEIQDSNRLNRARSLNLPSNQTIKTECSNTMENDTKKQLPQSACFDINTQKSIAQNEERLKRKISFRQSSARRLTSDSQNSSKYTETSHNEYQNQSPSELSVINRDLSKTNYVETTT